MSQTTINFRVDPADKKKMEEICNELGMSMSTAFNVFVKKVVREKRIPFDFDIDPFYSSENIARIRKSINELEDGKGHIHELIEV